MFHFANILPPCHPSVWFGHHVSFDRSSEFAAMLKRLEPDCNFICRVCSADVPCNFYSNILLPLPGLQDCFSLAYLATTLGSITWSGWPLWLTRLQVPYVRQSKNSFHWIELLGCPKIAQVTYVLVSCLPVGCTMAAAMITSWAFRILGLCNGHCGGDVESLPHMPHVRGAKCHSEHPTLVDASCLPAWWRPARATQHTIN